MATVEIYKRGERGDTFYMCYRRGRRIVEKRSTGTERKKEAERAAGVWEQEINTPGYRHGQWKVVRAKDYTWQAFADRYLEECGPSLADSTRQKVCTVFNHVDRYVDPQRLSDLTADKIGKLSTAIRKRPTKPITVSGYLMHLKIAMGHAVRWGMLSEVPEFPAQGRLPDDMRGRPLTDEEFAKLIEICPAVVGEVAAPSWRYFMRGLLLSGLRLGEAMSMTWDRHGSIRPLLDRKYPVFEFPSKKHKKRKLVLCPMAPEFAELLCRTPEDQRRGKVFAPMGPGRHEGHARPIGAHRASVLGCEIGRASGIVTQPEEGRYATLHDLRRTFAQTWLELVLPPVLQKMMRHASIETTMRYYARQEAEEISKALWALRTCT